MCDRDPLPWWTQVRVTLLGDAAHPMYLVESNCASQAILDARCLCDLLVRHPVPEALAAYQAERLPATTAVVRSNRIGGPERVVDLAAAHPRLVSPAFRMWRPRPNWPGSSVRHHLSPDQHFQPAIKTEILTDSRVDQLVIDQLKIIPMLLQVQHRTVADLRQVPLDCVGIDHGLDLGEV
jgi:hypothetical protein